MDSSDGSGIVMAMPLVFLWGVQLLAGAVGRQWLRRKFSAEIGAIKSTDLGL